MIKKCVDRIEYYYSIWKNFGFKLCFADFVNRYIYNENHTPKGKKWHKYKYDIVREYLLKKYGDWIAEYAKREVAPQSIISADAPIWFFWYQGVETAPELVNKCLESVKRNAGRHKIIAIDKNSIKKYITIPKSIEQKVLSGDISVAHFADIIRVTLLAEYGGIWTDATLYWSESIDKYISGHAFFTIRHGLYSDFHVCKGMWSSFFLASNSGNLCMCFLRDFFAEYCKHENKICCYYLIDALLALGYDFIPGVKEMLESVPLNNAGVFELASVLSMTYNHSEMSRIIGCNFLHKLSYKGEYKLEIKGEETYYKVLISD